MVRPSGTVKSAALRLHCVSKMYQLWSGIVQNYSDRFWWYFAEIFKRLSLFSVFGLKDEKLIKKQTYVETETCKLYSRVLWIFLPNFIKIYHYNFELYRFKVGAFLRHYVTCHNCLCFVNGWNISNDINYNDCNSRHGTFAAPIQICAIHMTFIA